jgi:hypothetical protein
MHETFSSSEYRIRLEYIGFDPDLLREEVFS